MKSADHCPAFKMTFNATPDGMALEVNADLQLWAVKVSDPHHSTSEQNIPTQQGHLLLLVHVVFYNREVLHVTHCSPVKY